MAQKTFSLHDQAAQILKKLRNGIIPAEDEAVFLNQTPLIDKLRKQVTEGDIPMLLNIIDKYSGATAGLA